MLFQIKVFPLHCYVLHIYILLDYQLHLLKLSILLRLIYRMSLKLNLSTEKWWKEKKIKKKIRKTISRKKIFILLFFFYVQTFLSFLYQVKAAKGLPPDDTQRSLWTVPAGIIEPSTYPDIIGGDGGSNNIRIKHKIGRL